MATAKMKVKAIAPWFGGKRTMAPLILRQLGRHTQYFEPFCGSMAVLFAKEPSQKETVNDLHGDLVNLAFCIQERESAELLYDGLQRANVCQALLVEARNRLEETVVPELRLPATPLMRMRAYWYFLASWMGRNGTAGLARIDYQLAVRWTKGGGSPTIRWMNAVESLPAWHRRLQNVVILNRDAFSIIDRFEDIAETAIYADPPYMADTRVFSNNDPGSKYLHEFDHDGEADDLFTDPETKKKPDDVRLRDALAAYKHARVVVSYYDCDRVRELYAGWTFIECYRRKNLHAQNGRGAIPKDAPEVLIVNGPEFKD